ncbi:MAG: uracil-DNA glycosylase [bacterium]|nr:uracil-DNA glycosylase [bacterium]
MNKADRLRDLEKEIAADKSLPLQGANLVFGEGNINCAVLFIGEAPGAKEDELKRPFVGRSGQLLDKNLEKIGWKRADVYITNIVKRRPPENRDPSPKEIAAYKPYLTKQIKIIQPKIIVTLGRFSMNYFLPEGKISRDQGKIFSAGGLPAYGGAKGDQGGSSFGGEEYLLMPMFHPAAAMRGTRVMKEFEKTFRRLPKLVRKAAELPKK